MPEETAAEELGGHMRTYLILTYGRYPTQEEFTRLWWAWTDEVEQIFDPDEFGL